MIGKQDILLGWVLAGIASHPETAHQWVFKGGTALKKCYFETYRFSEDLDFSLLPDAAYSETDLKRVLLEVARRTAELIRGEARISRTSRRAFVASCAARPDAARTGA